MFLKDLILKGAPAYESHAYKENYFTEVSQFLESLKVKVPGIKGVFDPYSCRAGYDDLAFQVDVLKDKSVFCEIGGGGVYSTAAKLSWDCIYNSQAPDNFFTVGFAIGVERLTKASGLNL